MENLDGTDIDANGEVVIISTVCGDQYLAICPDHGWIDGLFMGQSYAEDMLEGHKREWH